MQVLNIFLAMFRFEEFRELLDAILEPLNPNIPHVARSKVRSAVINTHTHWPAGY
jgi:hypothetical protein